MHEDRLLLGDVAVDVRTRSVRTKEAETRIDRKAMQVLVRLAKEPGRVVTKEEFFQSVWQGSFVSEDVLFVAIRTLRRALGDDARAPRFIETVPRAGYRLLVTPRLAGPRLRARWAAAGLVALALAAAGAAHVFQGETSLEAELPIVAPVVLLEPLGLPVGDPELERLGAETWDMILANLAREPRVRVARTPSPLAPDLVLAGRLERQSGSVLAVLRLTSTEGEVLWAPRFDLPHEESSALPERMARSFRQGALPLIRARTGNPSP